MIHLWMNYLFKGWVSTSMLVVSLHKGVNYGFYIVYTPKSTQAKSKVY